MVAVLRPVDHDRGVRALAGEARAAAARQHRRAVFPAHRYGFGSGIDGAGDDDADRHLTEVGGVGRIGGSRPVVKAHLAVDPGA